MDLKHLKNEGLLEMVQIWVSMYCWLEREGCLECGSMTGLE